MWAILPVKNLDQAKQRLSPALQPFERRDLFRHMVHDVVAALAAVKRLQGILLVSNDPWAGQLAHDYGVEILPEPNNDGHTAAVNRGIRHLMNRGVETILQVPGDIPTLTAEEVDAVLARHGPAPAVTIVPAHDRRGSNCVVLSPPDVIALGFGNDSFLPHLEKVRARGLEPCIVEMPGIGLDIDQPEDLKLLAAQTPRTRSQRFLVESGVFAHLAEHVPAVQKHIESGRSV